MTIELVPLLSIEYKFGVTQRASIDMKHVERMAQDYSPQALGYPVVSKWPDGTFNCLDGMHRIEMLRKLGFDKVQCEVFDGKTIEEEAELFRKLNNSKTVSTLDKFNARVTQKDPVAIAVKNILDANGWHIRQGSGEASFSAIAALEKVYSKSVSAARRSIEIYTAAYDHKSRALVSAMVEGMGNFLIKYDGKIKESELVDRLKRRDGGYQKLYTDARLHAQRTNGAVNDAVSLMLRETWNKARQANGPNYLNY